MLNEDMLLKLSKLGPKQIVLTGVRFDEEAWVLLPLKRQQVGATML